MSDPSLRDRYWQSNIRLVLLLLVIWFVVSFGFGILGVDLLNKIKIGGFPLGFWFSQQGSIFVFIVLIFVYATIMDRRDKKLEEDEHRAEDAKKEESA